MPPPCVPSRSPSFPFPRDLPRTEDALAPRCIGRDPRSAYHRDDGSNGRAPRSRALPRRSSAPSRSRRHRVRSGCGRRAARGSRCAPLRSRHTCRPHPPRSRGRQCQPALARCSWSQPRPAPVQATSDPSDDVDKLIGMSNGFLEQGIMSHFAIQPALTVPRSMRKARARRSDTWTSFDSAMRIEMPSLFRFDITSPSRRAAPAPVPRTVRRAAGCAGRPWGARSATNPAGRPTARGCAEREKPRLRA